MKLTPGVRREDMEICGREVWLLCTADLPEIVFGTQVLCVSGVNLTCDSM